MIYAALKVGLVRAMFGHFVLLATLDDMIRFDLIRLDKYDEKRQVLCAEKYAVTSSTKSGKSVNYCKNKKFMTKWQHLLRTVQWLEANKEERMFKKVSLEYYITGKGRDNSTLTLSMIASTEQSILYKWPKDIGLTYFFFYFRYSS